MVPTSLAPRQQINQEIASKLITYIRKREEVYKKYGFGL